MGKQTKRAKSNKKNSSNASKAAAPSKSTVVNKIRQGTVQDRHGALSALSSTVFSPESLSKNSNITFELIKAVSERILDHDGPTSLSALGCIGNYILFQEQQQQNGLETLLTPILLSKMKWTCDQIETFVQKWILPPSNNHHQNESCVKDASSSLMKLSLEVMEHWSIISLCLHAMCGVVERISTNDQTSAILHVQKNDFLSTTIRPLILAIQTTTSLSHPDSEMKKILATNEDDANIISDVLSYAARTLHSSCDDNLQLLSALLEKENEWGVIVSSTNNHFLPMLSRLHCSGMLVVARQFLHTQQVTELVTSQVIPLLFQCTDYHTDVAHALYTQVSKYMVLLQKEKDDEAMEKNIIRMVENRKESARMIARRQKQMKIAMESNNTSTTNMIDDDANDEKSEQKNKSSEELAQIEEQYERAINAWKNACLPLKLSIEVTANLCTAGNIEDDSCEITGWDADDNFDYTGGNREYDDAVKRSKEDETLLLEITNSGLTDRVLMVLGSILQEILTKGRDEIPDEAMEDLVEVVVKCSICLRNAFCNLSKWKSNIQDVVSIWKEFIKFLVEVKRTTESNPDWTVPFSVISAVVTSMGALLRFRSILVQSVDDHDLDFIMAFLSMQLPKKSVSSQDDVGALVEIHKECIAMLGILCSQPHLDEVNHKICSMLLSVLFSDNCATVVMIEILNALMDMYSADEGDPGNHEKVFKSENVIGAFEKIVPIVKRKIREEELSNGFKNEGETEYWKETIFNAVRFIKYKRNAM